MKRLIGIAVLVIVIVVSGALWWRSRVRPLQVPPSTVPTNDGRAVLIGGPKNISMLPILAKVKGFFQDEGVNVVFRPLATGKLAADAIRSHDLDFGVVVDVNVAYAKLNQDNELRVLAAILRKQDDALLVRSDRGIRGFADLIGKTVAIVPATTSDAFFWRALQKHGIDLKGVAVKQMPPQAVQAAIVRGDVDAASIWQPFRFNVHKELGSDVVEFANDGVYTAEVLLAATKRTADKNPEQTQAILRALIRAEQFAHDHPSEAQEILAREMDIEREVLTSSWSEYSLVVRLDSKITQQLADEADHIIRTVDGFKDKTAPLYRECLYPDPLVSVAPSRVNIEP